MIDTQKEDLHPEDELIPYEQKDALKDLFIDDDKFDELSADIITNQILKTTL